jgi:hypothetical protein
MHRYHSAPYAAGLRCHVRTLRVMRRLLARAHFTSYARIPLISGNEHTCTPKRNAATQSPPYPCLFAALTSYGFYQMVVFVNASMNPCPSRACPRTMSKRLLLRKLLLVLIVGVLAPLHFFVHVHHSESFPSILRRALSYLHTHAVVRHVKASACAHSQAAAAASAAADSIAAASSSSWPLIINASLVAVDRHYIDGWVVKGADVVATAVFEGRVNSHAIYLIDARGAALKCQAEQITFQGNDLCDPFVFVPLRTHCGRK